MTRSDINERISLKGLKKQVAVSTMTRKEICKKVGISLNQLADFLNSRYLPRTDVVAKLAYTLDCEVDDLIEFEGIEYKPELDKYSMLPTTRLKNKLSYKPLINMFYDFYGVQYGEKLKEMYSKLDAVFPNKSLEEKHGDMELKKPGKTCRLKIQNTESMLLYHIYEICNLIKCKPGCIFGYEGKYEEFPDQKKVDTYDPKEDGHFTVYFDSNTKCVDVYLSEGQARRYWSKHKLTECINHDYPLPLLQTLVVYDEIAESLKSSLDIKNYNNIPDKVLTYPLEDIDNTKDKPFFVNGEWRTSIFCLITPKKSSFLRKYIEGGWVIEKAQLAVDESTGRKIHTEDGFLTIWKPIEMAENDFSFFWKKCYKIETKKNNYALLHSGNDVSILSRIDNTYDKLSHFIYKEDVKYYKTV